MESFLYLKLGGGNCLADYWLSKNNVLGFPAAAIYFGICTAEDIQELYEFHNNNDIKRLIEKWTYEGKLKHGNDYDYLIKNRKQIVNFMESCEKRYKFITITPSKMYIYKPIGKLQNLQEHLFERYNDDLNKRKIKWGQIKKIKKDNKERWNHFPKYMPIEIIEEIEDMTDIPYILRSLPSNRGYNQKTCVLIGDRGIINAIKYSLLKIKAKPKNEVELLELLSPIEFETLIFLILIEAGLHVPAWRGGTLRNIDILAKNPSNKEIRLDPVIFKPMKIISFQVRRRENYNDEVENVDFVVTLSSRKYLTAKWVIEQVKKYPKVKEWLKNSLWWVSEEAINRLLE